MIDVSEQIAEIEKELLALTANQPPNANQMPLYTVTAVATVTPQIFTVVFDDGIIRLTKAFTSPGNYAYVTYIGGALKISTSGTPPFNITVVSMGAFHLV